MLTIDVFTLFPNYFTGIVSESILGRAITNNLVQVTIHDLRAYGLGKHHLTDDRPYGGGPGMVLLIEPIDAALTALGYKAGTPGEKILLTSAKGPRFTQTTARELSSLQRICLICGHYEGVDERVVEHLIDGEVRIGDFVLTGGEPAAAVITDAVVRLLPGVLGNEMSTTTESHNTPGELGHAQYSRPEVYNGWPVPPVLLSGNHPLIAQHRISQHQLDQTE